MLSKAYLNHIGEVNIWPKQKALEFHDKLQRSYNFLLNSLPKYYLISYLINKYVIVIAYLESFSRLNEKARIQEVDLQALMGVLGTEVNEDEGAGDVTR